MLTEGELAWLEHRDAMQFLTGTYIADFAEYPLWNPGKDWQDAAEFEARVAAKLANYIETLGWKGCGKHSLEQARLQVEEEMDGYNTM